MINPATLFLYTAGAIVIIISPGPDFIYVITRGIAQGRKAGILSALGISAGLIVHTVLAALGLSALVQTSGMAFQTVKFVGAAYLIYLGIQTLIHRKSVIQWNNPKENLKATVVFRQGVMTNVFNPKAIITFMAFIPQFIYPTDGAATIQIILLGGVISFLAIVWFGTVGYFAGYVGRWFSSQPLFQKAIRSVSGCVLVGLGLRLAFARKH
jgi:threonine/homoserine/homoserine lactone efflux protein